MWGIISVPNRRRNAEQSAPQHTPLVVRWWVAQRLLDGSLDDSSFGQKIIDSSARCLFYTKVGQEFAQLGDDVNASKAFKLSRNELTRLSDSSQNGQRKALARSLFISQRYLTPEKFAQIIHDSAPSTGMADMPLLNEKPKVPYYEKEYGKLQCLSQAGAMSKGDLETNLIEWINKDPNDCSKLKRSAFIVCEGQSLGINYESIVHAFLLTVDDYIKNKSSCQQAIELEPCLFYILSVKECLPGDITKRSEIAASLNDRADQVTALIKAKDDPKNTGSQLSMESSAMLYCSQVNIVSRSKLHEQLANGVRRVVFPVGTSDWKNTVKPVPGAYARLGFFTDARGLAEPWGAKLKLEAALGVFVNELGARAGSRIGSPQEMFYRRLTLNEDWLPDCQ
jgi:hypothetical protein